MRVLEPCSAFMCTAGTSEDKQSCFEEGLYLHGLKPPYLKLFSTLENQDVNSLGLLDMSVLTEQKGQVPSQSFGRSEFIQLVVLDRPWHPSAYLRRQQLKATSFISELIPCQGVPSLARSVRPLTSLKKSFALSSAAPPSISALGEAKRPIWARTC